jgi:hypothetical protein
MDRAMPDKEPDKQTGKPKLFFPNPGDLGDIDRSSPPKDECVSLGWPRIMGAEERRRAWARAGGVRFHPERQDVRNDAWRQMLELVEAAADDGRTVFWPGKELPPEVWTQIIELPPTISKLRKVKHLRLYGSHLVRIPPEIGLMRSLVELDAYCSYRLHWFPFEVVHCPNLRDSRISTRTLYGNISFRPPFPDLDEEDAQSWSTDSCSICGTPFGGRTARLAWVSYGVATDVLPLLVRACSESCLDRLPPPRGPYVRSLHRGGLSLIQPPTEFDHLLESRGLRPT